MKKGIKIILASVLILLIIFGVMFISKNNKIDDLRVSNLFITTKEVQGKLTGYLTKKCRKIIFIDSAGFNHSFRSARYAAKELKISYQTILDICNKKVKKPKFNLKFQEEK